MRESVKKVFISAGDPSGDVHGANLMHAMRKIDPSIIFYGLGRQNMIQAGLHSLHDMSRKSLMWLHVATELLNFIHMKRVCVSFLMQEKPLIVILIDYCGFNFHLARAAKRLKIPVVYYVSPQLWAHAPWRVKKIKKLVDKMLVVYPFEEPFYNKAGVPVTYVGHPLFDEIYKKGADEGVVSKLRDGVEGPLISILPGSRKQEIIKLLPMLLQSAEGIKQRIPFVKFFVSCNDEYHFHLISRIAGRYAIPCNIITGRANELIKASDLCIASAGTVTLQIAHYRKPMIIVYKITPFAYFIAQPFLITPYIGLVNKLANRMIVPELLTCGKNSRWVTEQAVRFLTDAQEGMICKSELTRVMAPISKPGASERAAQEIVNILNKNLF